MLLQALRLSLIISRPRIICLILTLTLALLPHSFSAYINISYNTAIYGEASGFSLSSASAQQQTLSFRLPSPSLFTSPPQILIAYQTFDVSISCTILEDIQAEITSISTSSFDLKVSKQGSNNIYRVDFQYIAIETSNNVFVDKNQLNQATDTDSSRSTPGFQVLKKFFPYKRMLTNSSETRKVSVFFTGYTKSIDMSTYAATTLNLYVYAQIVRSGFYVIAESIDPKDNVNFLQTVYFNYIEFYEPSNTYFSMNQIPNIHYLNSNVPTKDGSGDTLVSDSPIQVDIDDRKGIFIGMTNLGFVPGTTYARIQVLAQIFLLNSPSSVSTFQYEVNSWNDTQMTSFAFDLLIFSRSDCPSNSELFYDQLQICVNPCPNRSFQLNQYCKQCYSLCETCTGQGYNQCTSCISPYYLFINQCYSQQPQSTGCSGAPITCVSCSSNRCQKCDFNNPNICFVCKDTFSLSNDNNQCICEDPMYFSESDQKCMQKVSPFSQGTQEAASSTGKAAFYSNIALVIMQRFTNSGSVLISSTFTNQKIYYILLLYSGIPTYLHQSVTSKFNLINWMYPNDPSYNVGYRFDEERIPSDILANSGGAIILLFFISLFYGLFFIALRWDKLRDRLMSLFTNYVASFLIESSQICILVLQFGAAIAMTHQESLFSAGDIVLNIIIIFLSEVFIFSFLIFSTFQMNRSLPQRNSNKISPDLFEQIFVNPLLNNCMKEFWYTKVYMMIFVGIDGVLFPILMVAARMEYSAQIIGLIVLQLFELVCTIIIKPFYLKRETCLFVIEQANILLIYITIATIEICLSDNQDENQSEFPKVISILSILYIVLIFISLLTRMFVQIFLLFTRLIDYCEKRKQNQQHQNEYLQKQLLIKSLNKATNKSEVELIDINKTQSNSFNESTRDQNSHSQKMFQFKKYIQTPEILLRAQLQRIKFRS